MLLHDLKIIVLLERLNEHGLDLSSSVNINLFIQSMDFFGRVNAIYSNFFGSSPPARACVAVDLPRDIRIRLECIAIKEKNLLDRQSLHVQGLSYWAPANIGPYSQAIVVRKVLPSSSVFNLTTSINSGSRTCIYIRSNWTHSQ